MTSVLEDILVKHIDLHGPMDVGRFMNLALGHPQHGYYMKRDPLGRGGDFTTAPEISQMFGEMIGAWAADLWLKIGAPENFVLLECGPGRGTLVADMLRAVRRVPGFCGAGRVHLLETSPALRARQAESLKGHEPVWHDRLDTVPSDVPLIVIANEFLDALPFRQLQKAGGAWQERVICHEEARGFFFGLRPAGSALIHGLPQIVRDAPEGAVFEFSPVREALVFELAGRIKAQGGAALFIDYGHEASAPGDTFQAVHGHQYCDVFDHIGEADLTSHVDFGALVRAASREGIHIFGPVAQGVFLRNLGIEARALNLVRQNKEKAAAIEKDLHRLVSSAEMGEIFKVFCLSKDYEQGIAPAGF